MRHIIISDKSLEFKKSKCTPGGESKQDPLEQQDPLEPLLTYFKISTSPLFYYGNIGYYLLGLICKDKKLMF